MKKALILLLLLFISISACKNSTIDNSKIINYSEKESISEGNNIVQQNTESTSNPEAKQQTIALYYGIPLDINDQKVDVIEGSDISLNQKLYEKYERGFYLYSNGSYLCYAKGKIEERGLDYYWDVSFENTDNNEEIAISQEYNPYPRPITYTDSNFPKEFCADGQVIATINNQFNVNAEVKEICSVDMDGDGKNEYLCLAVDEKNCFFAKCLLNSNYIIIAYITVFKEKFTDFNELVESYNLQNSGEAIDINDDGIMEILIDLPTYEGFKYKIFTYKNGVFNGDFITKSSLQP